MIAKISSLITSIRVLYLSVRWNKKNCDFKAVVNLSPAIYWAMSFDLGSSHSAHQITHINFHWFLALFTWRRGMFHSKIFSLSRWCRAARNVAHTLGHSHHVATAKFSNIFVWQKFCFEGEQKNIFNFQGKVEKSIRLLFEIATT